MVWTSPALSPDCVMPVGGVKQLIDNLTGFAIGCHDRDRVGWIRCEGERGLKRKASERHTRLDYRRVCVGSCGPCSSATEVMVRARVIHSARGLPKRSRFGLDELDVVIEVLAVVFDVEADGDRALAVVGTLSC